MTTEAEAKAIEIELASGRKILVSHAELLTLGFVPASRLLAVEAELGRTKEEMAQMNDWLKALDGCLCCGSPNCAHLWSNQQKCCPDCTHMPPVAPEPAQENSSPSVGSLRENEQCNRHAERRSDMDTSAVSKDREARVTTGGAGDLVSCAYSICPNAALPGSRRCYDHQPCRAPDVTAQASSGEAAGDGVTHVEARASVGSLSLGAVRGAHCGILARYVDQQEQAECEAAGHKTRADAYENAAAAQAKKLTFTLQGNIELTAKLAAADRDRDTERAQKEAALAELEAARSKLAEVTTRLVIAEKNHGDARLDNMRIIANNAKLTDGLRAENEGLKALPLAKFGDLVSGLQRVCGQIPRPRVNLDWHLERLAALVGPPQQPTEAAPVAKDACGRCYGSKGGVPGNENVVNGEVLCDYCHAETLPVSVSVAKTEAPSEPAGWVPKPGARVRRYGIPLGHVGTVQRFEFTPERFNVVWDNGHGVSSVTVAEVVETSLASEPAPQPPATTGGALLGPGKPAEPAVDALRAEIVAALRQYVERETFTIADVADRLERKQP